MGRKKKPVGERRLRRDITLHPNEIENLEKLVELSDANSVSQFVGKVAETLAPVEEPFSISQLTVKKERRHVQKAA